MIDEDCLDPDRVHPRRQSPRWPSAPTRGGASSCVGPGSSDAQATLWPEWRHFAFVTDLEGDAVDVDAFHRSHARVELAIREPQRRCRTRARPFGQLLRQRRVAPLCRPGSQPHPLVRPARRAHPGGPARGGAHGAHSILLGPRSSGQSLWNAHAARAAALAMGRSLRPSTRPPPCSATGPALTPPPRQAHRRRPNQALTTTQLTGLWTLTSPRPLKKPRRRRCTVHLAMPQLASSCRRARPARSRRAVAPCARR